MDQASALFKKMFLDSKIAASYSSSRTKCGALLKFSSEFYQSKLVKKLQRQPFSLFRDGSNDGRPAQIYLLVVRLIDSVKGTVVTQLLSVTECVGPSSGMSFFFLAQM